MDSKLLVTSFRNVALASAYVFGVSQFLFYGEKLFQHAKVQNLLPFMMLLLLCLSAATAKISQAPRSSRLLTAA